MPEHVWNKPVISVFRERLKQESEPFAVIRCRKLLVKADGEKNFTGEIVDFYSLMGGVDYLTTAEGKSDRYVLCWFDDSEPDMTKDFRKLRGVAFNGNVFCSISEANGKRSYNAKFSALQGKLK